MLTCRDEQGGQQKVLVKPQRPKTSACRKEKGETDQERGRKKILQLPSTRAVLQASKLKETQPSRRSLSFPQEEQVPALMNKSTPKPHPVEFSLEPQAPQPSNSNQACRG